MDRQKVAVYLDKRPIKEIVYLARNERLGTEIEFTVYDGDEVVTFQTGTYFTDVIADPGGGDAYVKRLQQYGATNTHVATIKLRDTGISAGETFGYLKIEYDGAIVSTSRFAVTILEQAEV